MREEFTRYWHYMQKKALVLVISLLTYLISFYLLFPVAEDKATAVSLLPIIIIAWNYGKGIGLAGALIFAPINLIYLSLFGHAELQEVYNVLPGIISSFFIAVAAGYTGELQAKLKKQIILIENEQKERQKAEQELFNTRNRLLHYQDSPGENSSINNIYIQPSARLFREIADNSSDIIFNTTIEGFFTYVNKMGIISSGYSQSELFIFKYTDLIVPQYRKAIQKFYFRQYLQNQVSAYIEVPFITKEGQTRWFGQSSTLLYDKGNVSGFSIIARDITERKIFESALKESEEQLRLITETANDAIFTTDEYFIIMQWNKASEKHYGYSKAEIIGKPLQLLMSDDEKEIFNRVLRGELNTDIGPDKIFERKGKRKDGSIFPVEISLATWARNGYTYHTHIIRDISDRKESEQRLSQSEKDYRLLFRSAHEPILVFRPEDEVILEANDKACEVYGFDRSELIGMSLKKLSVDIERGEQKVNDTLNTGNLVNFNTVQHDKHGNEIFFEVNASILEYKGEKAILSINRNITEKLETKKRLQLLASATESASDMIVMTDLNNNIIYVNNAFSAATGYSEFEVLGKSPHLYLSERNLPEIIPTINILIDKGHWSGMLYSKKKNDKDFLISMNISAVLDAEGKIIAFVGVCRDITGEIEAHQVLKESEEKYRALFQNNPLPVIVRSIEDDSILAVNKTAVDHYGYSEEEFLKMKSSDLIAFFGDLQSFHNMSSDKLYQVHLKKDGSFISTEISTYRFQHNSKIAEIFIINDITSREQIQKEIIRQRDTAQRYLDVSAVLMCVLDKDYNIILLNKAGCRILGYSEEEVIGKNWIKLGFSENYHAEIKNKLDEIISVPSGTHEYFEYPIVTNYGQERIIGFHNTVVCENGSGVTGILFSGEDITNRKHAEKEVNDYKNQLEKLVSERTEKLREVNQQLFREIKKLTEADIKIQDQVEFFKTLINTIPIPVYILNQENVFLDCNKAFLDFYALRRDDVINKPMTGSISAEITRTFNQIKQKVSESSIGESFEINTSSKQGSLNDLMVYQAVLRKKDGTADGTVGVMLDITPQKIIQRETNHSLEKEKELNTLKSRFISTASHEFRTPLTTILASADLLEIMCPNWNEEKFTRHINKIQNAVSYMTGLIDDVLLINKAETGRLKFTPTEVNLKEVIRETIDNVKAIAEETHIFKLDYQPEREQYILDNKLFTQIITNLVSNAVKYSPGGGEVKLIISEPGLKLKLEISDNGIGISEDDVKHLCEPFQRGKNTGNIPGTGLGLSIVKKAVEIHGGEMTVQSILGEGTTFTIYLPILEEGR